MKQLKATVIMPTFSSERFDDTLQAVSSLMKQTHTDKELIVVVDRNKPLYDKLTDALPKSVRLFLSTQPGPSNARNLGIQHATGDVIAFIDDDIIVEKTWLSKLLRNYRDPNVLGVGGTIKPMWYDPSQAKFPREIYWILGCTDPAYFEKTHEVRNNYGGNTSFRRDVLERVTFSASFQNVDGKTRGIEDAEMSIRLLSEYPNHVILHDPEAIAYHRVYPVRTSLAYILRRAYTEGLGKAYITRLHKKSLARERFYLHDLLLHYLPTRLREAVRNNDSTSRKNALILLLVMFGTATGYGIGTLQNRLS